MRQQPLNDAMAEIEERSWATSVPPCRGDAWLMAGLALAVFAIAGLWCATHYTPLGFLVGDGPYYAETAVSILHDGDLDLRNQLRGGLQVHGPQIALGRNGAWYPKHPILLPLLALPFLSVFGMPGLLVFNLLVLAGVAAALYDLARLYATAAAAAAAVVVLILGTFLRAYAYNLSPDLLALLFVTTGLACLLRGRALAAGTLLGIAALGKILLLVLLPLAMVYAAARGGGRGTARLAAGCAGPLFALLALNTALFGSPLVTSYDRNVTMVDGRAVTTSHRGLFDNDVLAGLAGELTDQRHGLLPTAPALLLALPGFVVLARRRAADALLMLGMSVFLVLLLAAYREWNQSHYGNRFLMPVIACAAPAVALALQELAGSVSAAWRRAGERTSVPPVTP
jgi:4-amino-4-deoxy-L-arabinose transferase-like glycosyltransferase